MAEVFTEEKSMFFVGGRGDKSGRIVLAGGCTQDWWDTEVAASDEATALAKLMGATGAPIMAQGAVAYTSANERLTLGAAAFIDIEIGMVVYVIETPVPNTDVTTGRYTVTDVHVGGDWIECAGINGTGDASVDINIGGAFATLWNGISSTDANTNSVAIHTNLDETLAGTISFAVGGNLVNNTFKRVNGYNTIPGDMDRGGTYYETPFQILRNGSIDLTKCVTLDADGGAYDVMTFGVSIENCVLENIHLTGANNATDRGIEFADANSLAILLQNCRFSDMFQIVNATVSGMSFISCYAHDDITHHHYVFRAHGGMLMACVSKVLATRIMAQIISTLCTVMGCIISGGQWGVRVASAGSGAVVTGNTFYNLSDAAVSVASADRVIVLNNIFSLAPGAVALHTTASSIIYNDYNCFIETDGTPLTVGASGSGDEVPSIGPHSIELDPLFVDAAGGNFRLLSNSPCRRTAHPTVGAT